MTDLRSLEQLLAVGRAPAWPVAVRAGQGVDFAGLRLRVAAWRAAFSAQPGRRWALYTEDSFEFAAALFGAWHAGACVYLPADNQPVTQARLREHVDGFAGQWPADCRPLAVMEPDPTPFSELDPEAEALVVYTSGSSGEPSAIPKRLRQLSTEVAALAACWPDLPADARVLGSVSHQHIYGLLFRVLWPLAAGRAFAAERLAYPEQIAAALAQARSLLVASPAHLKRLNDQLDWADARANLAAVFSSGGPLPADALPACRALLGQAPLEIYGSSETGGIAWRQREDAATANWQPLPGVQLRVANDVLQVRSGHLPDADWHATSDKVQLGDAGFELQGRADRIVKIEEKRVSLTALEAALMQSGLLQEARVVSLPGSRALLGVVAVPNARGWRCYDEDGKRALNAVLRDQLVDLVEPSALPRRWRYPWALPVNSQGKTTEAELHALFDPRRPEVRLLAHDATQATLHLQFAAASPYFVGHFALAPVLPGVAQLDWVVRLARALFALPPRFLRLEAAKFQQVIVPDTVLTLALGYAAARGSVSYSLHSAAGQHASGRIVFGAAA
ncbi:AMP-binding protein [Chitinolyticbacter albus]|uniref:AMP-binding protein n=1 Tax=Chitinolyticbacter albus TaxID=2961951 RepID=UPI00210A15FE|nr:AMP-binding protein [Chitinolyticbacter albus]